MNSSSFFVAPKPLSVRLWHWLTVVLIIGTITTVLLNSTLFKARNNIAMIQEQVQSEGGSITAKQAKSVAHEYSDKLWMVHKYIGFGLSLLLLCRIVTEVTMSKEKKLRTRIQQAINIPVKSTESQHYLWVQYGYVVFYLMLIVMAFTGLVLAFEDWQWLDAVHKPAKQIHSFLQYGFYTYAVLHIAGTIRADLTNYGGIVSRMINGKSL
ncbi:MAG: hypothetical protein RJA07_1170 [Bacteroidota bacterium]|jgi:cytochrome b561